MVQSRDIIANHREELRPDLQESLSHSHINPAKLSIFQRIILTTDGTLTEILEAYLFEKINISKISEGTVLLTNPVKHLELEVGQEVIERKVLLQGKISRKNWIYAESKIVPERLDEIYRERLLRSQESIGRLWLQHKVETFKEIVDSSREIAGDLADHFRIKPEDKLLSRTYRAFSNSQPIMMITEKFPEKYFLQDF